MTKNLYKIMAVALALLTYQAAWAAAIDASRAREAALQFLNANSGAQRMLRSAADLQLAYTAPAQELYAFNALPGEGYVVVAGDDRFPSVIGYSDEGEFRESDMPENMREWLEQYAEQVRYVQSHPNVKVSASSSFTAGNVYPLLGSTKWNQSAPYNNLCPTYVDSNGETKRAVTGCVATAMAQVMYYHRWPQVGSGSNSYSCKLNDDESQTVTLSADFSQSHYDWDHMLPVYTGSETTAQNNAVARLMSDCGVAMNMGYGASSGAVTRIAMNRMAQHFGYDRSIKHLSRDAYPLDQWLSTLNRELTSARPVIHSGASVKGGHAFVIDGCNASGYYHVNWGWNGKSNGYFLLTDLTPTDQGIGSSEGGYNLRQGMICNIMPNKGSSPSLVGHIGQFLYDNAKDLRGSSTTLRFKSYYVLSSADGDAQATLALGITDGAGNLLRVATSKNFSGFVPYYNYSRTWDMPIPSDLADGDYYVVPLIAPIGTSDYQPMGVDRASNSRIKMTLQGNYAYFSAYSQPEQLKVAALSYSDVLAANRDINVKATISNSGGEFVDNLCVALLKADGSVAATSVPKRVDVLPEGEAVFETTVKPTASGNYTLAIIYASDSTVVEGQQPVLTISTSPSAFDMAIATPFSLAKEVMPTTHLEGKVTLYNRGGAFAGRLEIMIVPKTSNS
ncbi:MAG: C10 family peptidase, partial [Sodaliphilus sp.]